MSYTGVAAPPGASDRQSTGTPIPDPNDRLTRPFWQAASKGQLVIQQCQSCRTFHHPPVALCPNCLSDRLEFAQVNGKGRVYSWAIIRDQRIAAFDSRIPYVVASVELDDAPGITLPSNMPGSPLDALRHGMPVEVVFEKIAEGVSIPQFRSIEKESK